jgi:6,7-dimethyl-8-ribityllumazine synthase
VSFERGLLDTVHFALVVSQFNTEFTEQLRLGAENRLLESGILPKNIKIIFVPGAIEIPVLAKSLAKTKKFDAIIALGAVIRGDTDHYDYVCQQVSYGCQKVAIEECIPVIFGVLTVDNEEQAIQRLGGSHGHAGIHAADAALTMCKLMREL